jgi:hypothetical protein
MRGIEIQEIHGVNRGKCFKTQAGKNYADDVEQRPLYSHEGLPFEVILSKVLRFCRNYRVSAAHLLG